MRLHTSHTLNEDYYYTLIGMADHNLTRAIHILLVEVQDQREGPYLCKSSWEKIQDALHRAHTLEAILIDNLLKLAQVIALRLHCQKKQDVSPSNNNLMWVSTLRSLVAAAMRLPLARIAAD